MSAKLAAAALAGVLAGVMASGLLASSSCTTFDGLSAAPRSKPEAGAWDADAGAEEAEAGGPPGYLGISDAARVCALVFSCPKLPRSLMESTGVPIDSSNFALCVDWLAGPVDPGRVGFTTQAEVLKCVARAQSCAEAGQCVSFEYVDTNDPRCDDAGVPETGSYAKLCTEDGGAVAYCSAKYDDMIEHCGAGYFDMNSRCMQGSNGELACALDNSCPGATCQSTFFFDICDTLTNLHMRVNCSATGRTCGEDDAGYIGCITGKQFEDCTMAAAKCAEHRVAVCDGFSQSYFDCEAVGGTCVEEGAMAHCSRPAGTCNAADFGAIVCEGNSIRLCVGGTPVSFDCGSIGMTCKPGQVPLTPSCG